MLETEREQYKQEVTRLHQVIADLDKPPTTDELFEGARVVGPYVDPGIVKRKWGTYRVLAEYKGIKVKELIVNPQSATSKQYHNHRYELWFYTDGGHKQITYAPKTWHQLTNSTDEPMTVIEIQYGTACEEADIVRWEDIK